MSRIKNTKVHYIKTIHPYAMCASVTELQRRDTTLLIDEGKGILKETTTHFAEKKGKRTTFKTMKRDTNI